MNLSKDQIELINKAGLAKHHQKVENLKSSIANFDSIVEKLKAFQIARFG